MLFTTRALRRASMVVALAGVCSALSLAQKTFSFPHVLETSGRIVGIAWNLEGGQFTIDTMAPTVTANLATGFRPLDFYLSLYGNDDVLRWMIDNVNGTPTPASLTISSLAKDETVAQAAFDMVPLAIQLPGCDGDSKEAANIRMLTSQRELVEKERLAASFKAGAELAKKQKMWMCSNFRLSVGDLPCSRVNKIESISIKQAVADFDGDGKPESGYSPGDVVFEVPMSDAPAFQDALKATLGGAPKTYPVRLDYLDADGTVLLSVQYDCVIVSAAPSNLFASKTDPTATLQVRGHHYIGHVTIVK